MPDGCPCIDINAQSVLGANREEAMPEASAVTPADEPLFPAAPKDANNEGGESAELDEPEAPLPVPNNDRR